jgi:hypothetical protein
MSLLLSPVSVLFLGFNNYNKLINILDPNDSFGQKSN